MSRFNVTLIIPTVGRRELLEQLLVSIRLQTVMPREVLIVNGGSDDLGSLTNKCSDIPVRCINSRPPSLTRQRNAGIAVVDPESDFIGFLDDDIILQPYTLKAMLDFWEQADSAVGGASFNIISDSFKPATLFERLFQVNALESGRVLKSGFNTKICSIEETKQADWLLGGATVWKKAVIEAFRFDEWFSGYAHCEDVEYSYRVGKKYRLMVVKEARVLHLSEPRVQISQEYNLGKMHVVNRLYFVTLNPDLSRLLCYWACFGLLINNISKGIFRLDMRYIKRAAGNFSGLALSFAGKTQRIQVRLK